MKYDLEFQTDKSTFRMSNVVFNFYENNQLQQPIGFLGFVGKANLNNPEVLAESGKAMIGLKITGNETVIGVSLIEIEERKIPLLRND